MIESVTCPRCGMTSYHPEDVRQGYCSKCADFTSATIHCSIHDRFKADCVWCQGHRLLGNAATHSYRKPPS